MSYESDDGGTASPSTSLQHSSPSSGSSSATLEYKTPGQEPVRPFLSETLDPGHGGYKLGHMATDPWYPTTSGGRFPGYSGTTPQHPPKLTPSPHLSLHSTPGLY